MSINHEHSPINGTISPPPSNNRVLIETSQERESQKPNSRGKNINLHRLEVNFYDRAIVPPCRVPPTVGPIRPWIAGIESIKLPLLRARYWPFRAKLGAWQTSASKSIIFYDSNWPNWIFF